MLLLSVRFDLQVDCDFGGGKLVVQAGYSDVCGTPLVTQASNNVITAGLPQISLSKVGRNVTTGSGYGGGVRAEPGVRWSGV